MSRPVFSVFSGIEKSRFATFFGSILWLLAISAPIIESDTYRYAFLILTVITSYYYFSLKARPRMDWLGWLCISWAVYAVLRFSFFLFIDKDHSAGGSDWLYFFPVFFPILGAAFALYAKQMEYIIAAFFLAALIALLVTTDIGTIYNGDPITPLIQHNRIHGAVGCGIIAIGAVFWFLHYATEEQEWSLLRRFVFVVMPVIVLLCLVNIYGSKSKGVWLSAVFAAPLIFVFLLSYFRKTTALLIWAAVIAILLLGAYVVRHNLYATAGATVAASETIIDRAASGTGFADGVSGAIHSADTPTSMNERLQIWSNAWEIISAYPIFGAGNRWIELWYDTQYANVGYTLLHNGYLEILIRNGLFGALIFGIIVIASFVSVYCAYRRGMIFKSAMFAYYTLTIFYMATLLSNSNNRLAIGESFVLISMAFVFACRERTKLYERQKAVTQMPQTFDASIPFQEGRDGSAQRLVEGVRR